MSNSTPRPSRREFLLGSAMSAVGVALAACAGRPEPTAAPVPTSAPAATAVPPAATAEATSIPTVAATATAVPTVAAVAREAPELAAQVAAGKLPPLQDRLPKNPLVLSPVDGIGEYGGTIRSFSHWLGGFWQEYQYGNSPLRWIDDGLGIAPGHCESWETNANNTEWIVHFRQGLKWSDGAPCTVDDVLFWWKDMVLDPDHSDQPPDFGSAGGELAEFVKVDDYTLKLSYAVPAPLTAKRLAMWVNAGIGPRWIAPKHYLKQFHPTYNSAVANFEEFDRKILFRENPDCPTLTSWMCGKLEPSVRITWTRNPYYYAVDTEGNQLPYIDGVDEILIDDAEVQKLTIMQGDIDFVFFHKVDMADVSTLKENEERGGYEVRFWDSGAGAHQAYFWNYDHPDDKKRALWRNPKFKQAMSHALDRPTIRKVIYYDMGELTTGTYSPKAIEFNFSDEAKAMYRKARDCYVEYNPDKAKALLDGIGVVDANGDGWREFPDGSKLEVRVDMPADAGKASLNSLEIATKDWNAVGLNIIINTIPPSEFGPMWQGGKGEIHGNWGIGDGPDHLVYPSWLVPNEPERWAPLCGNYLMLLGTEKEDTECDKSPWDRQPPRWCSTEAELRDGPVWELQQIYQKAILEPDELKRHHMVWDMINIHIDQGPFLIGTIANHPHPFVLSKRLMNVPTKEQLKTGGFTAPWIVPFPAITNPETYAFKKE